MMIQRTYTCCDVVDQCSMRLWIDTGGELDRHEVRQPASKQKAHACIKRRKRESKGKQSEGGND